MSTNQKTSLLPPGVERVDHRVSKRCHRCLLCDLHPTPENLAREIDDTILEIVAPLGVLS